MYFPGKIQPRASQVIFDYIRILIQQVNLKSASKDHYDRLQRFYFLSMTHRIIIRTHFIIAVIFGVHFNFVIRITIIYCFNVVKQLNSSTTKSLFILDANLQGCLLIVL